MIKINQFLLIFVFATLTTISFAQKYTISGYLTDVENGEKLIGANIYDANTYIGTVTNSYGFFSLTLDKGDVLFTVSYVGYTPYQKKIELTKDISINIELTPNIEIEEVVVKGELTEGGVESSQMSVVNIPMKTIKNLPVLLGEPDIIKMVQLMPGVQSGSEGSSGMYVRGGGPDQNLILLDGVPVYNASHLFGFFSVFNTDAIQNVKLVKGGFPARYGGRLSSVLDINMKEGNSKEFHGAGSIGLISSKLMLEGPIGDKISYIVTGRRTYVDLLSYPFFYFEEKREGYDNLNYGYFFHDFNGKINYKLSNKSRLFFSIYTGKDKFYGVEEETYKKDGEWNPDSGEFENGVDIHYKDEMQFWWGNITSALRWNYTINNKFFINTTATYSRYKILTGYDRAINKNTSEMEYSSGISDWAGKVDFDYYPTPNHTIKFGVANIYHGFNPGVFANTYNDTDSTSVEVNLGNKSVYANEFAAYAEDDIRIGALLKMNVGIRWSGFTVGNTFYNKFEPRISMRYLINEKLSIKAAYAEMNQYLNLLANSNIGLPFDLWVPATENIKPQESSQIALGSVYAINKDFDISVEGYYKNMHNIVEYAEGASFLSLNDDWEEKVAQGEGWSYGVELLLMKKYGNTTGWIGYTLSKSDRLFDRDGETISFGKVFPYKFDRRHDISIVISHKINDHIEIGATWVFGTGNATTLGYEKYPAYYQSAVVDNSNFYSFNQPNITYYEMRNNFRMPNYHRLDIGVNLHKQKKWGKRTWTFAIYNVYNRKNPFMLQWEYDYKTNKTKLMQISLFPIIPSVSYRFEF
jgi:hypothetical protein